MRLSKLILFVIMALIATSSSFAQIGYQVSLLNNATGEPRANETVAVTVKITNSEGGTVCSETKTETTNDFGVLSMTVGSDAVFAKTDWSKLPFYISATVDGILIGRSQLLSVPVAECAKTLPSCKDKIMSKTWKRTFYDNSGIAITRILSFDTATMTIIHQEGKHSETDKYNYGVQGNIIAAGDRSYFYDAENNQIIGSGIYK